MNAWPALHQVLLDGWLLRFSRGFTRRANSVTPVYPALRPASAKVRYCENLYAQQRLRTYFRLTTIADPEPLDVLLAGRGYQRRDPTLVLHVPLHARAFDAVPGFAPAPLGGFLATYGELSGMTPGDADATGGDVGAAKELHAIVLKSIRADTVFGIVTENGVAVACGMAVIEQDLAGLFDIVTHPAYRRRGHGAALVRSLLAHAAAKGASRGYLQVLADNAPARALYQRLGFSVLYEYWYRAAVRGSSSAADPRDA